MKWVLLGLILANCVLLFFNHRLHVKLQTAIDQANEAAGCSADAPKVVPYRPGMTLCPGQTAVFTIRPGQDL